MISGGEKKWQAGLKEGVLSVVEGEVLADDFWRLEGRSWACWKKLLEKSLEEVAGKSRWKKSLEEVAGEIAGETAPVFRG